MRFSECSSCGGHLVHVRPYPPYAYCDNVRCPRYGEKLYYGDPPETRNLGGKTHDGRQVIPNQNTRPAQKSATDGSGYYGDYPSGPQGDSEKK